MELRWRLAELVGWAAVSGVGLVMLTQAIGWDGTTLIATLQSLTPFGLVLLAVTGIAATWARRAPLASAAALVGAAVLLLATPIAFPPGQPTAADGALGIRTASINLLYSNRRVNEVADRLLEVDADVIVFTEYTTEHNDTLLAHPLAGRYPHQINRDGQFAGGIAVWSRHPVVENERPDTINYTIDATLDGPDGTVRLFAVHPPTPILNFDGWQADLGAIGTAVENVTDPTIVVGDFNASYWHPAFRDLLQGGLTDAHMATGDGWSASWPTDEFVPPFVRLDHALTGNGLVSTEVDDFRVPGSDHVGFVVTVKPSEVSRGPGR